jgi:hypothetical protein
LDTEPGGRLALISVATLFLLTIAACDSSTDPGGSEVRVTPDSTDLVAGDETRLHATVLDRRHGDVTGATLEWFSADLTVATVDGQGLVVGKAPGTATITATAAGALGSARVRVLAPPSLAVSDSAVTIAAAAGGPRPEPHSVSVSNGGAGSVGQLSVRVLRPAGTSSWLRAELADAASPTTLTLTALTEGLAAGTYSSVVEVMSSQGAVSPVRVPVTLRLTGIRVEETDGGTEVSEAAGTDVVRVSLATAPSAAVVLDVSSDETQLTVSPPRLTFTPETWDAPQSVNVTGVDNSVADGDRESILRISVDTLASDPAFHGAASRVVSVTVTDDEAVGVSASTPSSHPDVSADGLVASYDLTTLTADGLLRDFSGRGLHGAISGTTLIPAPRGGGRLFQVATDRIELPPRSDFDLDGPLSIVTRMRLDVQRRHQHLIACDDKFALAIREVDQVRLSNTRGDLAETLEPLSPGVWHSVIAVFRGTAGDVLDDSNVEIWIDGARKPIAVRNATGTAPVIWRRGVLHASDACYIGFESHQGEPGHQNLAFYGAIDEMLVFGRALTPEEIRLLASR